MHVMEHEHFAKGLTETVQLESQLLWMEGCSINNQSIEIHNLVSHMVGNE